MRKIIPSALLLLAAASVCGAAPAASDQPASAKAQATIDKALDYLKAQQKPDGSWQGPSDPPAMTAIVLKCFAQEPKYGPGADFVKKGYAKLLTFQVEEGGIYKEALAVYNTAIAISALAAAQPEYRDRMDRAVAYLKSLQWTDTIAGLPKGETVKDEKDVRFGGWGYGHSSRPDGSNVNLAMDALHDAGLKPGDKAYENAVKFVTRLQNNSETNDQPWAGNDGGFIYTAAGAAPSSPAGEYKDASGHTLYRSYGSMTYAGLKSMIYAGLSKDDPRVKAAMGWVRNNWTLDENPGMRLGNPEDAKFGLYYYYLTMARALHAYGEPAITDDKGAKHDWRAELIDKLASLQHDDGSFVGDKRWMESNPILVTSYAVQALQEARADLAERPAGK